MCEQTRFYEEYESVDLTEDEQSSEENFANVHPLNFVDCASVEDPVSSTSVSTSFPSLMPSLIPIKKTTSPKCLKQADTYRNVPIILKNHENNKTTLYQRKTGPGKSCQIKPVESTLAETQDVDVTNSRATETSCIEPDIGKLTDLSKPQNFPTRQQITENQTIYSQNQPGKIVIIKKNNKYYKIIIPHNVMPNINQSTGPVLINIPEVGPLVIRNDPQVTKSSLIPINRPVSLNLDDVHHSQPKEPVKLIKKTTKKELSAKEAALCNKKFCWTYCRGRKRDLDGFTYHDRLGFAQAEGRRAKKCLKILDSIISKKQAQLVKQLQTFNKFKDSVNERDEVKLIKINAIVGKKKKIASSQFDPDNVSPPPSPKNSKRKNMGLDSDSYDSQNAHFINEVEHDNNYDSDLLLTKKVVILNDRDTETVTKRRKLKKKLTVKNKRSNKIKMGHIWARKFTQKKQIVTNNNKPFVVKPCYVQMVRDERVEEAYRKFYREMLSNYKQTAKVDSVVYSDETKVRNKEKPKITSKVTNINPTIAAKKGPLFRNTHQIFTSRIIISEEQFKTEMNSLKPILIVNEHNLDIINYSTQFANSNIIYVVQENRHFPISILRNKNFLSAFEVGYVKLVDAQLFCKYITNSGTFNTSCTSDHNYCISKNNTAE